MQIDFQQKQLFLSTQKMNGDDDTTVDLQSSTKLGYQQQQEWDKLFILKHSIAAKEEKLRLLTDELARSNRQRDAWKSKVEQITDEKVQLHGEMIQFSTYQHKILSPIADLIQQIEAALYLTNEPAATSDNHQDNIYALPRRLETCYHALKVRLYQPMHDINQTNQTYIGDYRYNTNSHHDYTVSAAVISQKKTLMHKAVQTIQEQNTSASPFLTRPNMKQTLVTKATTDRYDSPNDIRDSDRITQTTAHNHNLIENDPNTINQTNTKADNITLNAHYSAISSHSSSNIQDIKMNNMDELKKQLQEKIEQINYLEQHSHQQDQKLNTCKVLQGTMGVEIAKYTTDIAKLQRQVQDLQSQLIVKTNKITSLQQQQQLLEECRQEIQTLLAERNNLFKMVGKLQDSLGINPLHHFDHATITQQYKSWATQPLQTGQKYQKNKTIIDNSIKTSGHQPHQNQQAKQTSDLSVVMERFKAYQKDLDVAHRDLISKGQTHNDICKAAFKMQKQITNMRKEIDTLLTRLDWLAEERETLLKDKKSSQRLAKDLTERLKHSKASNENLQAEILLLRGEIGFKDQLIDHLRMSVEQAKINQAAIVTLAEKRIEEMNQATQVKHAKILPSLPNDIDALRSAKTGLPPINSETNTVESHGDHSNPKADEISRKLQTETPADQFNSVPTGKQLHNLHPNIHQQLLHDINVLRQQQLDILMDNNQSSSTVELVISSRVPKDQHESSTSAFHLSEITQDASDQSTVKKDEKSSASGQGLNLSAKFENTDNLSSFTDGTYINWMSYIKICNKAMTLLFT
ncbi:uncharacterized protein TRIADDRAFT_60096 [Trichoplax adhaerens]|uniref:Uncharacterized protein n=1 Tax=Trichoplax adhaerens TaxID=10228 RepID=B3S7A5_TRIAD|nr:hypothetical protein TRIADDRAFT_60096 [Trichoplax adhaerens]EDV21454.1 hypothetical protein TRIADDRAFT_60096 [Trichoplax adhaerens]|eukprot:XP_002116054.1 hypothetical protein TRIADDRAFT_60096 [Trichoplax adhaerens]